MGIISNKKGVLVGQIFFYLYSYVAGFGKPRVMGAIESLGCNWWSNMHQIDA